MKSVLVPPPQRFVVAIAPLVVFAVASWDHKSIRRIGRCGGNTDGA